MKKIHIALTIIGLSCLSDDLVAQDNRKWEIGVTAAMGRTYYDRKYYDDYRKFKVDKDGYISHFRSNYTWGAGLWIERHFNARFSGLGQISYSQTDILPDLFSQWYNWGYWYARETHHHGRAEGGIRWYINSKSRFTFFVEARAGVEKFLAAADQPFYEEKVKVRNAFGYDKTLPVASAAAGIKWRRWALMADYGRDLTRARRENPDLIESMVHKTGILSHRITAKATFTIFR